MVSPEDLERIKQRLNITTATQELFVEVKGYTRDLIKEVEYLQKELALYNGINKWRFCSVCNERIFIDEVEGDTIKTINNVLYCIECANEI